MSPSLSLYRALLAAGCELDSHESDLYVKRSAESTRILREHRQLGVAKIFTDQRSGALWYDVPFMYEPYWQAKERIQR